MKKVFILLIIFCILLSINASAGTFSGANADNFAPKSEISNVRKSKKIKTIQKLLGTKIGKWIVKKVIKKLHEKADRVLIDAPCSGLGVLKRNPDAKWKLQPEFIDNIRKVQSEVLESYSKIVKPGGKLVYATCSVLPSENQEQIKRFLTTEAGKNFTFVKDSKILASESGFDGFYMAQLQRKIEN